ncbi:glutamate--cysteine ligase [Neiella marina]|uniref:Glutamate--cysteine ligase n=1 Tax=Neiella holothuriorum TaxID=2870530 RepID=A0ABS7EGI7_9GAMM|nr:glutamate--cysteine ligase [Neiella holothuriorum]MBW8191462.1 glutamate--cysteine ligase [Neiella holothuriorum]
MGHHFLNQQFTPENFQRFSQRLEQNLASLQALMANPSWGLGPHSVGAELEYYLLDNNGAPKCCNQQLLKHAQDPQLTEEFNQFNLEYNLSPAPFSGKPFSNIEQQIILKSLNLQRLAQEFDAQVAVIGILPTLNECHLGPHSMTDSERYHALTEQICKRRGRPFHINIHGVESLASDINDLTLEGANTSFQFHYRVEPSQFNDTYNAIQLITPLVLAVAGNSPFLLGKALWHETRIALFKQSTDPRVHLQGEWQEPARVNLGYGWLSGGAYQLFDESVKLYPPLLPLLSECEPQAASSGQAPTLRELCVHHGTVWSWNRAIYDPQDQGHLRIELRALPAGPSAKDMVANAALAIGLAEGLKPMIHELITALPFKYAKHNFYRAAQYGLDARIVWPQPCGGGLKDYSVTELLQQLLPAAYHGLCREGVEPSEADNWLGCIKTRLNSAQTGASWQLATVKALEQQMPREQALQKMLRQYMTFSEDNVPVAEWPAHGG